jgi:hypothetical protein
MLFHGKKTVPAAIRRDMWTPYFSVHFPENSAGAYVGLSAFKRLRELATQRQLSPTGSILTATQDDIDIAKSKLGGPLELYRLEQSEKWQDKRKLELRLPKAGELLPKKLRAKRLMDQKATSVADVAFVLDWISSGPGPLEKMIAIETDRVARHKERTKRGRARFKALATEQSKKEAVIEERAQLISRGQDKYDRTYGRLSSTQLERLSMEHQTLAILADGTLLEGNRGKLVSQAEEQWRLLNPIDPALIDLPEYKERKAMSQAAEHEALKTWHSPENDASRSPTASMWTYVKEKREAALKKFDEDFMERKKSAALAQAATEATTEYEELKAKGADPTISVEDLVSKKQEAALKQLGERETEKKQRLSRAIEEAKTKLLEGPPLAEGEGEVQGEGEREERGEARQASESPKAESSQSRSTWSENWDIKMYWADLNDGLFAKSWPQNVMHGLLEPYAVAKANEGDENKTLLRTNKSVHVIGGGLNDGWMPQEFLAGHQRPKPKVQREPVESEPVPSPSDVEFNLAPIEQPSPPELGIFARLRNRIFGR